MKRAALFAVLLTSAQICCALTLSKDDELARDAAAQWLQLVDAGHFEEAASHGSTEVRSFDQWKDYFTTHRSPLGRLNRRELFELKHRPTFPAAFQVRKYYTLRFKTLFEHRSGTNEELVLTKIGCCLEIFEYKISDPPTPSGYGAAGK
jgi:hypothetical protein